ncbi:MAG: DUF924 domain-containing protein [Rhodospirillales bacterium]|nr:MAG: DUF924 domain-containing protein [Rhodospirillales bacterium]
MRKINTSPEAPAEARAVLEFWFVETEPPSWFKKNPDFDETVRNRFAEVYRRAATGALEEWRDTPLGCLALIIVLDQFPRNMFRGDPRSFATDAAARDVLRHALEKEFDVGLSTTQKQFLYLPLQHSEEAADQALSVALNAATGDPDLVKWADAHKRIIDRFGRFPHRNEILGRATTAEEAEFLAKPGSSF